MVLNRVGSGFNPSKASNEKSEQGRSLGKWLEPHGKVDPERSEKALSEYYAMMNWDVETGNPTQGKLMELGLGWVAQALKLK